MLVNVSLIASKVVHFIVVHVIHCNMCPLLFLMWYVAKRTYSVWQYMLVVVVHAAWFCARDLFLYMTLVRLHDVC